ncbi:hypothetical protein [Anaerotalea alkaliphila]|uniref:HNH endonuclease n=1 Tax=Anaerotalea alkaliphila TaxID=2662126 RepID=A0A7X5HWN7_9FIRM|nr:hypothetical protein [Anaerotalea alkaliphila]NDL68002.1 hypothetical protein [Anaerotalea alkaliphila]
MPGICPICGKPNGRNKKACSHACYAELRQNYKTCIVCGKQFPDSKTNMTVTCSLECSKRHRKDLASSGIYDDALDAAHKITPVHPKTGSFETNIHAKSWTIKAPDGKVYKCRNLKLWCKEHADLFDGTPRQAWDGLAKIKYSAQGKRKNRAYQWKGWTLIDYDDSL